MIFDTVTQWYVLHYQDSKSNKIWGYFRRDDRYYAFWGGLGQAASFKSHGMWLGDLVNLSHKKKNKGYNPITLEQLQSLDSNFVNMFNDRFTWFLMSHSHQTTQSF